MSFYPPLPDRLHQLYYVRYWNPVSFPDPTLYGLGADYKCYPIQNPIDKVVSNLYLFSSPSGRSKWTIFFCHGNGDVKYRLSCIYKLQQQLEVDVWFLDYRGCSTGVLQPDGSYSRSRPTQHNLQQDVIVAWHVMLEQRIRRAPIILYGLSIGSGVSSNLLAHLIRTNKEDQVAALVLDSPFVSLESASVWTAVHLGESSFPLIAEHPTLTEIAVSPVITAVLDVCNEGYVNAQHLTSVDVPILAFQATKDLVVNPDDCNTLVQISKHPLSRVVPIDADHSSASDYPEYYTAWVDFLHSLPSDGGATRVHRPLTTLYWKLRLHYSTIMICCVVLLFVVHVGRMLSR